MFDPLVGVSPVNDGSQYASYVDPDFVHVSPVYKSDASTLNPVSGSTHAVNAKGERRGLFAYKIIGVGADPDGSGSKLPNLIIEVVNPALIDLGEVNAGAGPGLYLVL